MLQFDEIVSGKVSLDDFISDLTDEELGYLMVGNSIDNKGFQNVLGAASKYLPGSAGMMNAGQMIFPLLKFCGAMNGPMIRKNHRSSMKKLNATGD